MYGIVHENIRVSLSPMCSFECGACTLLIQNIQSSSIIPSTHAEAAGSQIMTIAATTFILLCWLLGIRLVFSLILIAMCHWDHLWSPMTIILSKLDFSFLVTFSSTPEFLWITELLVSVFTPQQCIQSNNFRFPLMLNIFPSAAFHRWHLLV